MRLLFSPEDSPGAAADPPAAADPGTTQDGAPGGTDSGAAGAAAADPGAAASPPAELSDGDILRVLADPKAQDFLGAIVSTMNEGASPGQAQATPAGTPPQGTPSAELDALRVKAEAGEDPEAQAAYVTALKEQRVADEASVGAEAKAQGQTANAILNSPEVKGLTQETQGRLYASYVQEGLSGLTKALIQAGATAQTPASANGQPTPEEAKAAADALAAKGAGARAGTPTMPGATNPGGPGDLNLNKEQGEIKSVTDVWDEWDQESPSGPSE